MSSLSEQRVLLKQIVEKTHDSKESLEDQKVDDLNIGSEVVSSVSRMAGRPDPWTLTNSIGEEIRSVGHDNDQVTPYFDPCSMQISGHEKRRLQDEYLKGLHYDGMYYREASIAPAHAKTFQWIFEKGTELQTHWEDFGKWLESESQIYWITGKAGSGKSTLMKFISAPQSGRMALTEGVKTTNPPKTSELRCSEYLKKWSGDKQLLIGSFYFWAAGSQIQTSTEGLFRTLLHKVLVRNKHIVPNVSPRKWEKLFFFGRHSLEFNVSELQILLSRAISYLSPTTSICFFIDGLDEFKGHHQDLIAYFKDLIAAHPVKICFASRPGDNNFERVQTLDPGFSRSLFHKIVNNSEGVFLWVRLVVESLLDGMREGDRVSDLQKRLDAIPKDLEDLFQWMLDDLSPDYKDHAAQYFQLVASGPTPLPTILLSFADEEDDYAVRLPVKEMESNVYEAPLAGFSGGDVRELWALRMIMSADEEANSSFKLAPTTRALLVDSTMSAGDTVFLSGATYCGATPFVLSKIRKGSNGASNVLRDTRAKPTTSSSKLSRMRLTPADTLRGYGERKRKFSWPLYHAVVGGISESHLVSEPLIQLLLNKGANPNFEVPTTLWTKQDHTNDYSPWMIAVAIAVRVSSDDQKDLYAAETWGRVIKLMLSFGASVNRATVSQSVHMLGAENDVREILAVIGEDMVDRVLQALRAAQRKRTAFRISGYSLAGINKGLI
ncbi:hypothetical protein INS49_011606 [Diaporthe citri]|uniref:uncharacterized protein n=1 Tax=Diaporthe citri TaxID=83186 RepID=UPI001C8082E5|nr:uncharacterized protein INS49_011606 [Diaporthe citri]KAG6360544.1 hypothetical protein INS49_011606 [Diaporthe citri]